MTLPAPGQRVLETRRDTVDLGAELAAKLRAGDVVVLDGPLGAGKTAFASGVAEGLGVQGRVTSPTFVLARRHRAGAPDGAGMVHVDAYRLLGDDDRPRSPAELLDELESLDLDSALTTDVVVVEWGAGVAEVLADRALLVELTRRAGSEVREASWRTVTAPGA